jgi:ferredoxin
MKTLIFYHSGTGNSLWVAKRLAQELGNAQICPMQRPIPSSAQDAEAIGFVFPVHMWGVPRLALDCLARLKADPAKYCFAAAVNAGQVSRTLVQLQEAFEAKGMRLSCGFDFVMPSNYIPWGGPGPRAEMDKRFRSAEEKAAQAAALIRSRGQAPVDCGPLWQRIAFTAIYKLTFPYIFKMDRDFWVDSKCSGCGICAKVCPVGNIAMIGGNPLWRHACEQCLACIQWCPTEALQYGKKTPLYERYHHPEVALKEMIAAPEGELNR